MGGCGRSFTNEFRRCRIMRPNADRDAREIPSHYVSLENVIGTPAGDVVELISHVR
jgi:hypothetical protein